MRTISHFLRNYPVSCLCIIGIWILCLIPIPETPLSQVKLIDKWTHLVMFGGLSALLWSEHGYRHAVVRLPHALPYATLAPLLLGGAIEIAQATLTHGTRSGDIVDFFADALGVAIGTAIGIPLARFLSRRNRDS